MEKITAEEFFNKNCKKENLTKQEVIDLMEAYYKCKVPKKRSTNDIITGIICSYSGLTKDQLYFGTTQECADYGKRL